MNYAIIAVVSFGIGVAFTHTLDQKNLKLALDLIDYYKTRGDYYFDGANKRQYLDICNKDGEVKVLFKDECVESAKNQ